MATKRETAAAASKPKREVSAAHKAAMAAGRDQGRHVNAYLAYLEANAPKRGRKRTVESVQKQMIEVDAKLDGATGTARVLLLQKLEDLTADLKTLETATEDNSEELIAGFVANAKGYSQAKGISHNTWRQVGVPAAVLKQAGI